MNTMNIVEDLNTNPVKTHTAHYVALWRTLQ